MSLRDEIAKMLSQHETLNENAPYRVMPSDCKEWCEIKAIRILALPEMVELQRKASMWDRVKEIAQFDHASDCRECIFLCRFDPDECPSICEIVVHVVDAIEGCEG